ncbi:branched-chain amino acid ABC transporter substrate-binding protein [Diaphorobacter caeni]|uniref:branched-chain amino acid ABC transporter substrate-binding protein n=1 Tax=Diaphorobacter caeni TaxID=2784387 RepID=UPI00188E2DD1|nr:branched-chain amino acid ABC transporter substrate-binding protein [Diaphorobacter caeni]MBF5006899.1 branched-chain amino acid ABC transporter substrate-binding protein [Diaphorobacter caeni]
MHSFTRIVIPFVGLAAIAAAPVVRADIVIGVAGPMSGQYASGGEQMRNGVEAAVAAVNAAGGVLGQKLKVEIGDDACDPKQAVAVANAMVNKKVSAIVGHYCSSSTIPASEVYNEAQIPMITISTNGKVTERGMKGIFRLTGRDDQEGVVAAEYLSKNFAGKKIAVIDDKSAYGKGQADVVVKSLTERKNAPVLRESITAGEKDYTALVTKLKAAGVDALFYGGYYTELGLILRQAKQGGMNLSVMSGNTSSSAELATAAGSAIDGLLFTFYPDPRKYPASAEIVKRFRDNKIEPEGYVLFTYAAVQVYAQALQKAGSLKYADVQKALANGSFDSVIGKVEFDAKGDPKNPGFLVYQWKGKQYDVVK